MYNQRKHHQDRIVAKRMKRANLVFSSIDLVSEEVLQKVTGRARKTKPWDCGRPQCPICGNPRRVWKYKTLKEEMVDLAQKEMLGEDTFVRVGYGASTTHRLDYYEVIE